MGRTRSRGAWMPRFRPSIPLLLVATATLASLRPALAGEPGLTLALAGFDAAPRPLDPGWPSPLPAHFGLGEDAATLALAASRGTASGPAPDGAATPVQEPTPVMPLAAYPHRVWRDFGALVERPVAFDSHDWANLALGAGLVGVVSLFDRHLRDTVQAHSSTFSRNLASGIRPLGTWGGLAAMGLLLGTGEISGDANLAATGADGLEAALFAAGFVTPVIKEVAGRQRPNAGNGGGAFRPFSGQQSLPSGEATEAFAIAAVVSNHTASPVLRGVAWGLAGLVGWGRVQDNAHWASDVVAGALIGSTIGNWVSRRNRPGADGHTFALQPMIGPGMIGVNGSLSW